MNELDIAGLLRTYSEKCAKAPDTKTLRKILNDLREDIDLRKVRQSKEE